MSLFAEELILHFVDLSSKNHSFTNRSFKILFGPTAVTVALNRFVAALAQNCAPSLVVTTRDAAATEELPPRATEHQRHARPKQFVRRKIIATKARKCAPSLRRRHKRRRCHERSRLHGRPNTNATPGQNTSAATNPQPRTAQQRGQTPLASQW